MNRPAFSRPAPAPRPATVDYPDSDGQPVAETDFQRIPLWYANDVLARHFRDRDDIYVSANMFVYFEEGNPKAVVAPDVFVVLGTPDHKRRSYKVWEEPKGPDFVLEITSHSTRSADQGPKRRIYEALGVREYWLFDPTGDYLVPPLQGLRLVAGRYVRLPSRTSPDGSLSSRSELLGLDLRAADGRLRLRDPATGRDLPSSEELEERVEQQAAALRAAEARVAELEARMRAVPRTPSPKRADTPDGP